MPDQEPSKRTGIAVPAIAAGRLMLKGLTLILRVAGAVAAVVVISVLVRFEALGDLEELGVSGTVLTVASVAIAVLFVALVGWFWHSDRKEAGLPLLRRIGRRAETTAPADWASNAAVRLRVRGEVVATNKEMGEKMLSWLANEAFGTTWTVWLDVYEVVRVDAVGKYSREPSALGLLELNGSSLAGVGKLRWRDQVRLECTGGGRILDVLEMTER